MNRTRPMRDRLFVAAYGVRYEAFLATCLESVCASVQSVHVEAWIGNMDAHSASLFQSAFPDVTFLVSGPIDETVGYTALVSGKWEQWSAWFQGTEDGDRCFLIDADTLVRADIFEHFPEGCDVLYTYKPERWPLNLGVVGAVSSEESRNFFLRLLLSSREILNDSTLTAEAVQTAGAVDQFAFLNLLGVIENTDALTLGPGPYRVEIEGHTVVLQGIECRILNQTNSVPYNNSAVTLHYKANMRDVIEHDGRFNMARPAETSRDMVGVWESTYRRFCERTLSPYVASGRKLLDRSTLESVRGLVVESRGVLNSEAACFAGLCRRLGVQNVVESGRARAHSTLLMAKLLPDVHIYSIEYENDADAQYGVSRVHDLSNVTLIEGDARFLATGVLGDLRGPTALFIDGPKGKEAVCLAQQLVADHEHVVLVGIHDMHRNDTTARGLPNISRHWFAHAFDRHLFSDDAVLLATYSDLDVGSGITPHRKGPWDIGSYGPTLGLAIVTWRDRSRVRRERTEAAKSVAKSWPLRFLSRKIFHHLPTYAQHRLRGLNDCLR